MMMLTRSKRKNSSSESPHLPLVGYEDGLIISTQTRRKRKSTVHTSSTPKRPLEVVTLDSSNPVSQYTLSDTSHDGNGAGLLSPDLWDETLSGTPSVNLTQKVKVNKVSALLDSSGDNIGAEFTPILKSKRCESAPHHTLGEFTEGSDSMFLDLLSSGGQTDGLSPDGTCTFVPSSPPYQNRVSGSNTQTNTQTTGSSVTQSSATSQLSTKESQSGGRSVISRLQNRYKRGLASVSQTVTQPTTQITQDVQKERLQQVQKLADTLVDKNSLSSLMPSVDVGFYGLPEAVRISLEKLRGIKKLYEWQDQCLRLESLKERRNLVYTSPTSGGKTLVAEIMMLRELLLRRHDCLLILPFVSLVQEKIRGMSELAVELDFLIEEYAGSRGSYPPKMRQKRKSIYIATIEKANGLINSLIESNRLDCLGLCVVDELHMLGEKSGRGATLEMTLTKLRLANKSTQIVGMSATLNNMQDLCEFLDAELYVNNFRPVQLEEYVKMGDDLYKVNNQPVPIEEKLQHHRHLVYNYDAAMKTRDADYLTGLLLEVIPKYSCLVFCPTKKNCESVAQLVCSLMPSGMKEVKKAERELLLKEMAANCGRLCNILAKTILYGVAYHHSGLTMDERKLIEEAYISTTLCCIVCTSTLAAGVNLPAKRVIVRAPYVGMAALESAQYKQMIGRAGRAGIDSSGESILIVQHKDRDKVNKLIGGPMSKCVSSLNGDDGAGMRNFVLNLIGIKLCSSVQEVYDAISSTLFAKQSSNKEAVQLACDTSLSQLASKKLVVQKCNEDGETRLEVTDLGTAAYKGCIEVDIASVLYDDLCKAQLALSVQNYLHLIYLITPYSLVTQFSPDWSHMFNLHCKLSAEDLHVGNAVGVTERFLHRRTMNHGKVDPKEENIHRRFFVALMLYDLYREQPVWEVADKFHQNRGFLQNLLQSAISFASCVYYFTMEMEQFWAYHAIYGAFIKKFSLCAKPELNALMELPGVKIGKATLLYKAGFRSLQQIAYSEVSDLTNKVDYMTRSQARQIKATALMIIKEKSEALRAEADAVIALPTPVPDVSP